MAHVWDRDGGDAQFVGEPAGARAALIGRRGNAYVPIDWGPTRIAKWLGDTNLLTNWAVMGIAPHIESMEETGSYRFYQLRLSREPEISYQLPLEIVAEAIRRARVLP